MSSLDNEVQSLDLSQHFSVEDHDKLISYLTSYKSSISDNKVYLIPKEHLTVVTKDEKESYVYIYDINSSEAKDFVIPVKNGLISGMIRRTFSMDQNAKEIPLPGVSSVSLKHIIKYMNHQDGIPSQIPSPPITSKKMSDIVKDSWVAKFCDDFTKDLYVNEKDNKLQYETYTKEQKDKICGTRTEFYDVITASNYMEITDLLHILSAKVATMIKQTPVEKMKGIVTGTHEIEVVSENKENKEITTVVPYGEISVEPVGIKNCN